MALSDFFSSLLPTTYAEEAPEKAEAQDESKDEQAEEPKEEAAEEEEEEPEDPTPALREECQESSECKGHTHHFLACQEKVTSGQGFKGEDCVEELCTYTCLIYSGFSLTNTCDACPVCSSSPHDALRRQLPGTKTLFQASLSGFSSVYVNMVVVASSA